MSDEDELASLGVVLGPDLERIVGDWANRTARGLIAARLEHASHAHGRAFRGSLEHALREVFAGAAMRDDVMGAMVRAGSLFSALTLIATTGIQVALEHDTPERTAEARLHATADVLQRLALVAEREGWRL